MVIHKASVNFWLQNTRIEFLFRYSFRDKKKKVEYMQAMVYC